MINLKKTAKIYKIIKKVKEQIKYLLLTIKIAIHLFLCFYIVTLTGRTDNFLT